MAVTGKQRCFAKVTLQTSKALGIPLFVRNDLKSYLLSFGRIVIVVPADGNRHSISNEISQSCYNKINQLSQLVLIPDETVLRLHSDQPLRHIVHRHNEQSAASGLRAQKQAH